MQLDPSEDDSDDSNGRESPVGEPALDAEVCKVIITGMSWGWGGRGVVLLYIVDYSAIMRREDG